MRLLRGLIPILALACASRTAVAQVAPDSARLATVHRLLKVSRVREMMDQMIQNIMTNQLRQMPQVAPYATILRDFYREQMDWTVLEPEFSQVYLEVFTDAELKELIAFYESPVGRMLLDKTPELILKSNQVSSRRLEAAMPKLTQRLQDAMLGSPPATTPPTPASPPPVTPESR